MWTRGELEHSYGAYHLAPWIQPEDGWPGYGARPCSGGTPDLTNGLSRGPALGVMPGFGYAKDPSDPATWDRVPILFT